MSLKPARTGILIVLVLTCICACGRETAVPQQEATSFAAPQETHSEEHNVAEESLTIEFGETAQVASIRARNHSVALSIVSQYVKPRLLSFEGWEEHGLLGEWLLSHSELGPTMRENEVYRDFRASLESAEFDGQRLWIVEDDVLVTEGQLVIYFLARMPQFIGSAEIDAAVAEYLERYARRSPANQKAVWDVINGKPRIWSNPTLTYYIDHDSFPDTAHYALVKANLAAAASDWSQKCKCSLRFEHRIELDDRSRIPHGTTTFVVRFAGKKLGSADASAFAPNVPYTRRTLYIGRSYYTSRFDRTGILRHELGHILGLRHEHARADAPPECRDSLARRIAREYIRPQDEGSTQYDSHSVMHYLCKGGGSVSLEISEIDAMAARNLYPL